MSLVPGWRNVEPSVTPGTFAADRAVAVGVAVSCSLSGTTPAMGAAISVEAT
jgi:hypothetical protein